MVPGRHETAADRWSLPGHHTDHGPDGARGTARFGANMLSEATTEYKGTEIEGLGPLPETATATPVETVSDATWRAFLGATVAWVLTRRRDLRPGVLWLTALLCGDEWWAARGRGRKAVRRLVLRDVEDAARACRTVLYDPEAPEYHSAAMALCVRSTLEARRPAGPGLWIEADQPRTHRRVARAIRRCERARSGVPLPKGDSRVRWALGFRSALAITVRSCPILPVATLVHAGMSPWRTEHLAQRAGLSLAYLVLDLAAYHHTFARRRGVPAGSFGNAIVDRALAWVGGDFAEVEALFGRYVRPIGGAK